MLDVDVGEWRTSSPAAVPGSGKLWSCADELVVWEIAFDVIDVGLEPGGCSGRTGECVNDARSPLMIVQSVSSKDTLAVAINRSKPHEYFNDVKMEPSDSSLAIMARCSNHLNQVTLT